LNFVKRNISRQNHFCQIAKFGEDILTTAELQQVALTSDLDLSMLIVTTGADAEHPRQSS